MISNAQLYYEVHSRDKIARAHGGPGGAKAVFPGPRETISLSHFIRSAIHALAFFRDTRNLDWLCPVSPRDENTRPGNSAVASIRFRSRRIYGPGVRQGQFRGSLSGDLSYFCSRCIVSLAGLNWNFFSTCPESKLVKNIGK